MAGGLVASVRLGWVALVGLSTSAQGEATDDHLLAIDFINHGQ